MRYRQWWGGAFAKREAEDGDGAKTRKQSLSGSVSGAPMGIIAVGDGEGGGVVWMRWWWW